MAKYGAIAGALLLSVSPLAVSAYAQETGAEEEIVVTAQRRAERLQDVPIAVTAIGSERLEAAGADDLTDIEQLAPGLQAQVGQGFFLPRIRGIGTVAAGSGLENSVAVYVDGVYYASQAGSLLALNNIERVEVLRGPQGTLFGRNSTGGLIQVVTRTPTDDFLGSASVSYGSYETATADGYISGGIAPGLAADLAVRYSAQGEGYGENIVTGNEVYRTDEDLAARTSFVITPSPQDTITLAADYMNRESSGVGGHTPAPVIPLVTGVPFAGSPWDMEADTDPLSTIEAQGVSGRYEHDFGSVVFTSISAYRESWFGLRFDQDGTGVPFSSITNSEQEDTQFTQEFILQSAAGAPVQWTAGVFYLDGESRLDPFTIMVPFPFPPPTNLFINFSSELGTVSSAVYGQATFPIGSNTNLTLGARYTDEERTSDVFAPAPGSGEMSFSELSWRVALDHRLSDTAMVYASFNRGFKSGGFNALSPTNTYDSEELDAFEVGFKTEYFDRRLMLNGAAFYYQFSNLQISDFTAGPVQYRNAPEAELYGADFDLTAQLTDNLSLVGGLALLHSEFTDYPNAPIFTPRLAPPFGNIVSVGSVEGNEIPYAPDATFNLSAHYETPLSAGTLFADVGYYYNTGWFGAVDNNLEQEAYDRIDAAFGWRSPGDRYSLRIWGRNLTDEAVASGYGSNAIGSLVTYEPPATYGVTLSAEF